MSSVVAIVSGSKTPSAARRARLLEIIREKSFSNDRKFTLSSGRTSFLYFDMKPTMLDSEASYLIANMILEILPQETDYVGGLEMGAVPIVSALCPVAHMLESDVKTFFVRKRAKGYGAKKLVEGLAKNDSLHGKNIVVVDDVTTTGGSVVSTFDTLRDLGANILMVVSVVDREEGATQLFEEKNIPFRSLFTASDFQ